MKTCMLALGVTLAVAVAAAPAGAQVQFGVQANLADEFDLGLGLRLQGSLAPLFHDDSPLVDLMGAGSFDAYFPGACGASDCSYLELNGNALYPFEIGAIFRPYAGGGLHLGRRSVDVEQPGFRSDTRIGLNAIGGADFDLGGLPAFLEGKLGLGGWNHFVLRFGVLLGGSG